MPPVKRKMSRSRTNSVATMLPPLPVGEKVDMDTLVKHIKRIPVPVLSEFKELFDYIDTDRR